MPQFTPSHLGQWEPLYRDLIDGHRMPLTADGSWMLGEKSGLVVVFDADEPVFITAAANIAKTVGEFIGGGAANTLRTCVAVTDLGASPKTAAEKARNGRTGERVTKRLAQMQYRVAPAPAKLLEALAEAFTIVADPRYNGPTARANSALDALPQSGA
jgi:hypothetical protein